LEGIFFKGNFLGENEVKIFIEIFIISLYIEVWLSNQPTSKNYKAVIRSDMRYFNLYHKYNLPQIPLPVRVVASALCALVEGLGQSTYGGIN
jgi:hypothetical protein